MINLIQGLTYNFEVVWNNENQENQFLIRAIEKSTGRSSCINNLNAVLSEFDIDIDDPKSEDSSWIVTKDEAKRFYNIANCFLVDKRFRDYIERHLDEDRLCGEWANIEELKK